MSDWENLESIADVIFEVAEGFGDDVKPELATEAVDEALRSEFGQEAIDIGLEKKNIHPYPSPKVLEGASNHARNLILLQGLQLGD